MKKMMIAICLIVIFFICLITGIVTYLKIKNNPDSFEFKPSSIYLAIHNIGLEKKVSGDVKVDVTDVIVEEQLITIVTENNLALEVFGIPVKPGHDHEEIPKEELVEQFYYANSYFEIYDEEGNLLNEPQLSIVQFKGKQKFVILAKKPEKGNKIKVVMYERTTQAYLGETEVKFRY